MLHFTHIVLCGYKGLFNSHRHNSFDMLLKNSAKVKLAVEPRYFESALLMEDDHVVVITSMLNPE
jgi:hypothetical protein